MANEVKWDDLIEIASKAPRDKTMDIKGAFFYFCVFYIFFKPIRDIPTRF